MFSIAYAGEPLAAYGEVIYMPSEMIGQFARDAEMCSRCGVLLAPNYRSVCVRCTLETMHPKWRARIEHLLACGWRVNEAGYPRHVYWFSIKDCD